MSIFMSPRGEKDDGIKCIICHKPAAVHHALYDMKIGFCDGESIDGSMVVATHENCLRDAIENGKRRRP